MRRAVLVIAFVFVGSLVGHAQIVVYDGATTFRNSVTAALKEYLLTVQQQQHSQLRRMAQRLSMFTNLGKYTLPDPPRWRTHAWENNEAFLYSTAYHAALNYGDASGSAYLGVSQPVLDAAAALGRLSPSRPTRPDSPAGDSGRGDVVRPLRRHTTPGSCATTVVENCWPSKRSTGMSPTGRWSRARPRFSTRSAAPS